jgi:hypothetical protein
VPRIVHLVFAVALSLGLTVPANATSRHWLNSLSEKRYVRVRPVLISAGFTPVRFSHASNRNECSGREWCDNYPETEHCSGTGIALCQFVFFHRKSGRYLAVVTYGESRLTVLRARYLTRAERTGWSPHVP